MELCSRTTRRGEIGLIPPEIQTEALKNALSLPQPAAHGPVALPGLAQGVCRKLLHFCISIPACKGFGQSINSLSFPLATQSSRGRSPLLPSATQMDGTTWNICAPQTRGAKRSSRQDCTLWELLWLHGHLLPPRVNCSAPTPVQPDVGQQQFKPLERHFLNLSALKKRQEDKNW